MSTGTPTSRVLVIQLRQLGDILMITPLLRQLRKTWPQAEIDVLCEPIGRQLLEHNRHVSQLLHLKRGEGAGALLACLRAVRARRYDLVIDAQGLPKTGLLARLSGARTCGFGGKSWRRLCYGRRYTRRNADYSALDKLRLAACLPGFEADPLDLDIDFPVGEADRRTASAFCARHFAEAESLPDRKGRRRWKVAALFGVSRQAYKVWPPEKLAEIGRRLAERGYRLFLVHGPGEEQAAGELASAIGPAAWRDLPMLNFAQLKEVLGSCALFVGNDGGPKHLAASVGVPCLALFGRVHPQAWTDPRDPFQQWIATASHMRSLPTDGPCEEAESLAGISVEAVWKQTLLLLQQVEQGG